MSCEHDYQPIKNIPPHLQGGPTECCRKCGGLKLPQAGHKESMNKEDMIEITGLDRNVVLAALCNNTPPLGMGAMNPKAMEKITADDCAKEFEGRIERNDVFSFDYVFGRPVKVNFVTEGDKAYIARVRLYDRDAGQGMAQKVISELRA